MFFWEIPAVDLDGHLIVFDAYNYRIQIFNSEGNFIKASGFRWKRFLKLSSAFYVPSGVAVDTDGFIYIADSAHQRVGAP